MVYLLKMVIFHSYVSLPEDNHPSNPQQPIQQPYVKRTHQLKQLYEEGVQQEK
jgi:hypothetical protein